MFSGREKTFACLIMLFAASAASASPTVSPFQTDSHVCSKLSSADRDAGVVTYDLGSNAVCDQIGEFARAILQPPLFDSRTTAGDNRCLPAVPPAFVMVLAGFMCISLIRDRKAWLAVLAGLLWVGQTGINALPELTSRLSRRVHTCQPVDATLAASYPLGGCYYPDSYNSQTRYIGLLRHLAGIPKDASAFTNIYATITRCCPGVSDKNTHVSPDAIVLGQLGLSKLSSCLVSGTRQFVCFTPAFIFVRLPRGPPLSARIIFGKPAGV